MKACPKCAGLKPVEAFPLERKGLPQRRATCRACVKDKNRIYYEANKERVLAKNAEYIRSADPLELETMRRRWKMQSKYGLTLDDYDSMFDAQGGVCAVCKQPEHKRRLAVDHCHATGKVRGLLCFSCNSTLGKLEARMDQFIAYLSSASAPGQGQQPGSD